MVLALAGFLALGGCAGRSDSPERSGATTSTTAAVSSTTSIELTPAQVEYRDAMGITDAETQVAFTYSCSLHDLDLSEVHYANAPSMAASSTTTVPDTTAAPVTTAVPDTSGTGG